MNCRDKSEHPPTLHNEEEVEVVVRSLVEQFSVVMGKPERVAECCSSLERCQSIPPSASDVDRLASLLPLLAEHCGPLVVPLYRLIEQTAASSPEPWPLIKGMLAARDKVLVQRSLQCALCCVDGGSLAVDRDVVGRLADLMELPGTCLGDHDCLPLVANIVRHMKIPGHKHVTDPFPALFLKDQEAGIRRMAARLLDLDGAPASMELAEKTLGRDAFGFLSPFLTYTRASHVDILSLIPAPGVPPPALSSLRRARELVGEILLRQLIAEVGWQRLNVSLEVRQYVLAGPTESLPLVLSPGEAKLAEQCGEVGQTPLFLAIAHGGSQAENRDRKIEVDPASRFRNYNLAHAEVLADFLAVAPLSTDRIRSILARMDGIVGEFIGLFSSVSDECPVLGSVYEGIKNKILGELSTREADSHLSPDLTRLTVMFEDPQSLGQVRTLHGLKRYLHQKGLQLGFKLVQRTLSTNRTVGLYVCSQERVLQKMEGIRYADFEPQPDGVTSPAGIQYPVAVVADGFARQLLYGQETYPRVDIFCYGNEVHYFLAFRNHPAFVRINYSPPLQGGMIDLEYYGVSKYELSEHPDSSLNALQRFFRGLGFEIQVENTRVHARYDKEQTPDLRSLCEKAEALFCLAPYLLDIDWTIGNLNLDPEARQKVGAAWAESFAVREVLPLAFLLTKDRQGIIESVAMTPTGRREMPWSGKGAYRDRFSSQTGDFFPRFLALAGGLSVEIVPMHPESGGGPTRQIRLDRSVLLPLREAAARGELIETPRGLERNSPDLFQRISGPQRFAELIASGEKFLQPAATLAHLVAPLMRVLSFRTRGNVGCFEIQSARLSLRDEDLGIHVLRGETGGVCLAFYTHGIVLYRRREKPGDPWKSNASFDAAEFLALLRRANYAVPGLEQLPQELPDEVRRIRECLARSLPLEQRKPLSGEQTISGLRASPGRAVGRVLFGTKERTPEDFAGAILVTAALQLSDGAFLHRAAGVVSTGGGILSHAALLAVQFGKPAIIIDGKWESDQNRGTLLHYSSTEYEPEEEDLYGYHICSRRQIRECNHVLHEGDLVALDAKEDLLRVLGQDPDTLALHEEFHQFTRATFELARAATDKDVLLFRGRRIRARHQIEKILTRLNDPALACHAVQELVQDSEGIGRSTTASEKGKLLGLILNNSRIAGAAENHLRWLVRELRQHAEKSYRDSRNRIPDSASVFEVLSLRVDALRAIQALAGVNSCLKECGRDEITVNPAWIPEIDQLAHNQLGQLKDGIAATLKALDHEAGNPRSRHLLRQWERIEQVISLSEEESKPIEALNIRLLKSDKTRQQNLEGRSIIWPEDGGLELFPFIGWKAANLAEIRRITEGIPVPPWFVVADRAFRQILLSPANQILPRGAELPDNASSMAKAIEGILGQSRLDRFQKSTLIRSLWDSVVLPAGLTAEVTAAYRRIGEQKSQGTDEPLVALRSSSHEEDAEIAARAGEFDTFLFIQGEHALLRHLLWTWSGLWSDRALHTRELMRTMNSPATGGVIVQQIINSRISGVLQTVNVARNNFREIVINAGWGLGEGIVSGTVAADQIIVSKEGDLTKGPLQFSYVTADKREHVVFNKRAGFGTIRCEAPYHLRLRPALEYAELCELVAAAVRLEAAYGYPLDIEFGIEESRLWILQVRPVPSALSSLRETLQNYPMTGAGGPSKENHHD